MKKYKVGEMAEICGVSVKWLQRLDRSGVLPAKRTISNRRYYTEEDVQKYYQEKSSKTN